MLMLMLIHWYIWCIDWTVMLLFLFLKVSLLNNLKIIYNIHLVYEISTQVSVYWFFISKLFGMFFLLFFLSLAILSFLHFLCLVRIFFSLYGATVIHFRKQLYKNNEKEMNEYIGQHSKKKREKAHRKIVLLLSIESIIDHVFLNTLQRIWLCFWWYRLVSLQSYIESDHWYT